MTSARAKRLALPIAVALLATGCIILYRVDPTRQSLVPCMFHKVTGLYCPGCGATRAAHCLLHGDFVQAFRFNPVFVLALPYLIWAFYQLVRDFLAPPAGNPKGKSIPSALTWGIFAAIATFAIARNVPIYPCTLLSPPPGSEPPSIWYAAPAASPAPLARPVPAAQPSISSPG